MKFLISLSWKNLSRYRKRTIITASAIAVGLAMYIFIDGWLRGAENESTQNLVTYETAPAKIMAAGYYENLRRMPLQDGIENPGPLLAKLGSLGVAATPRTVFSGELILNKDPFPENGSVTARVIAVDPTTDERVYDFRNAVSEGRYLTPDDTGILMGAWLAEDLKAKVGYPITIVTRGRGGFYQTIDTQIVGLVNTPNPAINRSLVMMTIQAADRYLAMKGTVTEIDLKLPLGGNFDGRVEALASQLGVPSYHNGTASIEVTPAPGAIPAEGGAQAAGGLTMVGWRDLAKDYLSIAVAKQSGSSIILILVFIIAAVGVSNTMLMAIYERTREMGMMRAMGMQDGELRLAFLFEAAGIGLIGSVIGVAAGVLADWYMVARGIDIFAMLRNMDVGYRIASVSHSSWNPQVIVIAFVVGILMSVLVAYFPTRRALKLSITDCLRDT